VILGAIEIGTRSTALNVAEVRERDSAGLLERVHPVSATLDNLERLSALLMAEIETARDLGAERVEVLAGTELRGTRLIRLLSRPTRAMGAGEIRIPAARERLAATFIAATAPAGDDLDGPVAVAHVGTDSLAVGVGEPGRVPAWTGVRPAGAARITGRARFSDPPRPVQIEAAVSGASRLIASLAPPPVGRMMVVSRFARVIERLCGSTISPEDSRRGLGSILGQTSDDLAAWFGIETGTSRLLPATIAGHAALAETFGIPVEPVACDPVAGREWLARAETEPAGRGR
jgi:hypothetical protein